MFVIRAKVVVHYLIPFAPDCSILVHAAVQLAIWRTLLARCFFDFLRHLSPADLSDFFVPPVASGFILFVLESFFSTLAGGGFSVVRLEAIAWIIAEPGFALP